MASLATAPALSATMTPNDDGVIGNGLLLHHVGKAEVLEGGVLHLYVRQYGVVSHGVGVAWLVNDLEDERRDCGYIELGDLAK